MWRASVLSKVTISYLTPFQPFSNIFEENGTFSTVKQMLFPIVFLLESRLRGSGNILTGHWVKAALWHLLKIRGQELILLLQTFPIRFVRVFYFVQLSFLQTLWKWPLGDFATLDVESGFFLTFLQCCTRKFQSFMTLSVFYSKFSVVEKRPYLKTWPCWQEAKFGDDELAFEEAPFLPLKYIYLAVEWYSRLLWYRWQYSFSRLLCIQLLAVNLITKLIKRFFSASAIWYAVDWDLDHSDSLLLSVFCWKSKGTFG